jgi:DNA repair protein RadA/Sms
MARSTTVLRCGDCGASAAKWVGRCANCGAWGSVKEAADGLAVPLVTVDPAGVTARPTGLSELDRVLGGGLVPGSVAVLGGEPGIGKSTLLLQALASIASTGATCLLVCAEESAAQVRARAGRLGLVPDGLLVLSETSLPAIARTIEAVRPTACVVDSVQTVSDPTVASAPGAVAQVRACAGCLTATAKAVGTAIVLVGHVTKDGVLAGPRVLEHVVDTVLSFEGDRHHALRLLRAVKHRFGATGEVGIFEMTDAGMRAVTDPSGLFLAERVDGPGSAVVATVEGRRPLLAEVQALVGGSSGPKRATQGVDASRVALLLAVLEQRVGVALGRGDVFVSAVGGARLSEPAADLGIALAIVSALTAHPVVPGTVAVAEIGLGGELRPVPHVQWRLAEAARLGFRRALVGTDVRTAADLETVPVATLGDALQAARLPTAAAAPANRHRRRYERPGRLAPWRPG